MKPPEKLQLWSWPFVDPQLAKIDHCLKDDHFVQIQESDFKQNCTEL